MKKINTFLSLVSVGICYGDIKDGKVIITPEIEKAIKDCNGDILSLPAAILPLGQVGNIQAFYEKADQVKKTGDVKSLAELEKLLKGYTRLSSDFSNLTLYATNKKDTSVADYLNKFVMKLVSLANSKDPFIAKHAKSCLHLVFPEWSSYSPAKFGLLFSKQHLLGKEWSDILEGKKTKFELVKPKPQPDKPTPEDRN